MTAKEITDVMLYTMEEDVEWMIKEYAKDRCKQQKRICMHEVDKCKGTTEQILTTIRTAKLPIID